MSVFYAVFCFDCESFGVFLDPTPCGKVPAVRWCSSWSRNRKAFASLLLWVKCSSSRPGVQQLLPSVLGKIMCLFFHWSADSSLQLSPDFENNQIIGKSCNFHDENVTVMCLTARIAANLLFFSTFSPELGLSLVFCLSAVNRVRRRCVRLSLFTVASCTLVYVRSEHVQFTKFAANPLPPLVEAAAHDADMCSGWRGGAAGGGGGSTLLYS